jgi:hypothetical protein
LLSSTDVASPTIAHGPLSDVDVLIPGYDGDGFQHARVDSFDDPLGPARGILFGTLLGLPFWAVVIWLVL